MRDSSSAIGTPRISRRWRGLARTAWWVLAGYPSLLFILALPPNYAVLRVPCDSADCLRNFWALTSAQALALQANGVALEQYAALVSVVQFYLATVCTACGLLIFLRRPDERIAYIASLALVVLGTFLAPGTSFAVVSALPWLAPLVILTYLWGNAVFPALLYLLPDGQFVPRWSRWFFALLTAFLAYGTLASVVNPSVQPDDPVSRLSLLILVVSILVGVYGQVYRYRHVATPLARRQILWIGLGMAGMAVGGLGLGAVQLIGAALGLTPGLSRLAGFAVSALGFSCLPVALTVCILRYRLWDIDVIFRRTLVYSVLSAVLALAYVGSVLMLQTAFRAITGQGQNSLVSVLSTLAIAALFGPVRAGVQRGIDRRFFRRKYDAARMLAQFASAARDETDLDRLSAQLVGVVKETMEPTSVGLWLRMDKGE